MAKGKRQKREELDPLLQSQDGGFSGTRGKNRKTIKDLTASECAGSLKLIHILHRTLLMQLKKRIELERGQKKF